MSDLSNTISPQPAQTPFERIRQVDEDSQEFWSAHDLMVILEYASWQKFKSVVLKAQIACENSGYDPSDHFNRLDKMVTIGSDAKREVEDMHLSRYGCYLIVQNADPTKEVVALGQTYFAVQTRRQEISDAEALAELTEAQRRLLLRQRIKVQNTDLASASKNAGVITSQDFRHFPESRLSRLVQMSVSRMTFIMVLSLSCRNISRFCQVFRWRNFKDRRHFPGVQGA